jgi:hypothetical protein
MDCVVRHLEEERFRRLAIDETAARCVISSVRYVVVVSTGLVFS